MQTSLWVVFVVVVGIVGFLIGYSQPQYQPRPASTVGSAETAMQQTLSNRTA